MAEANVQSSIIKDACNKAIEEENIEFKDTYSQMQESDKIRQPALWHILKNEDFEEEHNERISNLEAMVLLASISDTIQINENDILLLNLKLEDLK